MKTIIEPFKIKVIEPIFFTDRKQREKIIKEAYYNIFLIHAKNVVIDLLTDSGTSAMSAKQWGGIMEGDEAYAGSESFFRFERVIKDLTGFEHIIPVHQGRAAEKILFATVAKKGDFIPNNTHFDTTRANVEFVGAEAVDFPCKEGDDLESDFPFKGNIDLEGLENLIKEKGAKNIPLGMITITNNSNGGQPASLENIEKAQNLLRRYGIPLFLDACRFAENSYFIKLKEKAYQGKTVKEIAQKIFSLADGCTMSAKKDGFGNIGGFLAFNNDDWAGRARNLLILTEGFPTYGGLAGRDLEALAQGLEETVEEDYLQYRIRSVEYLGEKLIALGVPIVQPPGGHAIYVDAKRMLPHLPAEQFPAQALVVELYLEAGIRAVEIGKLVFGEKARKELVRLAIPRRVYTQSHIDYVIEAFGEIVKKKDSIRGLKLVYQAPYLRHFTARFELV